MIDDTIVSLAFIAIGVALPGAAANAIYARKWRRDTWRLAIFAIGVGLNLYMAAVYAFILLQQEATLTAWLRPLAIAWSAHNTAVAVMVATVESYNPGQRQQDEIERLEAVLIDKVTAINSQQATIRFYQADVAKKEQEITALRQRIARMEIELRQRGGRRE